MTPATDMTRDFIGVDLSGATPRLALVGASGEIRARVESANVPDATTVSLLAGIGSLRRDTPNVAGIGIGVSGLVDPRSNHVVVPAASAPLLDETTITEIERAMNLPIVVANDANAAAYGEHVAGAGREANDMFYVTIGRGIGGAIILGGRLWTGASGYAGEFGHITVDPEGEECYCGNTGCLETVASAPSIVRRTRDRLFRDGTSSLSRLAINPNFKAADVAREAANGDDFALLMIERTGRSIGAAIASVINLLNTSCVVLGGGVVEEARDLILEPITREAARRAFKPSFDATTIRAATLGADAVSIGAAMLARDHSRRA